MTASAIPATPSTVASALDTLETRLATRTATAGVIGLGYVGLPLAVSMAEAGFRALGFDVSERPVDTINGGGSHIQDVPATSVAALREAGMIEATRDFTRLAECDVIAICVPTPLGKTKDPDMSYVQAAAEAVAATLRPGQLIVLESTTYPGTTRDLLLPIFEAGGLRGGVDFCLAFSPERVDPGNPVWQTKNTPKIMGGLTPRCTALATLAYEAVIDRVVPVSSPEAAELVKLLENTFRMINIGLANEMAIVCDRLGVNVWEVIDAAATKPFGFMKFTPGPGLGGHCIPLDPHYLAWKMRTLDYQTVMIDTASRINADMPAFWVSQLQRALNDAGLAVRNSRILILGVAYKKDIDDLRESPALPIMDQLHRLGARVEYHDPHCPEIRGDSHTPAGAVGSSVDLTPERLAAADAVMIVTDHSGIDYHEIARSTRLVIDTRGVLSR